MEGYYKLLSTKTEKVIGYVSFEPCRNKDGKCYTVKCKVNQMCDCLFLRMEPEVEDKRQIVLRRFVGDAQGTFVYFSIDKSYIDDFIFFANEHNFAVYACASFEGHIVAQCVLNESNSEKSARAKTDSDQRKPAIDKAFDPFETVNKNYKWLSVQNIDYLHSQGLIFGKVFSALAEKGFALFGHLLAGKYYSEDGVFTVIGVPDNKKRQMYEFGRWVEAKKRYMNKAYTGYWLFYFSDVSKRMVRPVIRVKRRGY